jgi:hypothetical protein
MTRRNLWPVSACVFVLLGYLWMHYAGWRYRGGPLIDHGLLGNPRYEATFSGIPFDVLGSYSFSFTRFPGRDAAVMLIPPRGLDPDAIERLSTRLRVRIVGRDGTTICEGAGTPALRNQNQFIVTSSSDVVALYHANCLRLNLQRCDPCRLDVAIESVDRSTPRVKLVPTLQGGGVELP